VPATVQTGFLSLSSWARGVLGFFARRSSGASTAPAPQAMGQPPASADAGQLSALLRELARTPSDSREADWDLALVRGGQVGRYRLIRELGRGGFGRVWEAEDEAGRAVALKALKRGAHPALREERLLQEADVAARLSHPAIVPVLDMGHCAHGPWLAMELLRGETLASRLGREAPAPEEGLRIALAIAGGVAHAHAHGVVHRDLKPGNVFVCRDGQVKLLDFGLAHAFGTVKAAGGTPAYMAPEQWRGAPEDERSDVFSLGVILHQLLAGALPFPAGAGQTVEGGGLAPALEVEGAPRLGRLVARMLERDPVRRPRHGQEVLAELERVDPGALGGVRVLPAPRLRRAATPRRHAVLLGGAGLAALALLALGSAVGPGPRPRPGLRAPLPAQMRLAVLPFEEVGGGPAEAALAAGLGELVTARLRQLEPLRQSLRVVAAQEVARQGVRSPREAKSAFDATLALLGSVRTGGGRLTLAASLVDADTADLLAAFDVEAPRGESQALEQKLVARVAEALQLELASAAGHSLPREPPAAPGAYEFYLQGRGYLQRHDKAENLESAISVLDRALERDPSYALAWAGKAEALLRRYEVSREARFLAEARSAGLRAQELGAALAPVHLTLGLIRATAGEHAEAVRSFQQALEAEPRNADAMRELARSLDAGGHPEEAEAAFRRAIELRPDSWAAYKDLARYTLGRGRVADALPLFQRVVELTPDNYIGHANLGAAQFHLGELERAAEAMERSLALRPSPLAYSNLGTIRYYQQRFGEAVAAFRKSVELTPADAAAWGELADALRAAGRREEAREASRQAVGLAEKELQINPRDGEGWGRLAMWQAALGDRARSLASMSRAIDLAPVTGVTRFRQALVYEQAGRRAAALEAVRAALAAGHPRVEIAGAPPLEPLRRDPRYAALVKEINHPR